MATVFPCLTENLIAFIKAQAVFFVATAGREGRVNLSPKGLDTLRILGPSHVQWLSLTGSGNETAAHVRETARMTLMFCAFTGEARILRLYGQATVLHPRDAGWAKASAQYPAYAGARQIFDVALDRVQISCGTSVPVMELKAERGTAELLPFYEDMGEDGVKAYWARKNRVSIDGQPTGTVQDSD